MCRFDAEKHRIEDLKRLLAFSSRYICSLTVKQLPSHLELDIPFDGLGKCACTSCGVLTARCMIAHVLALHYAARNQFTLGHMQQVPESYSRKSAQACTRMLTRSSLHAVRSIISRSTTACATLAWTLTWHSLA